MKEKGGARLLFNPFSRAFRQPAVRDGAVAGGFRVAPEGDAYDALPPAGHAGPRIAAEAPAVGLRREISAVSGSGPFHGSIPWKRP